MFNLHYQKNHDGVEAAKNENTGQLFRLPYRMVFAVASENEVLLYDTQQQQPIAYFANLHYHTLSDLTWSHDGRLLVVSSTDGYCSLICFDVNELGIVYSESEAQASSVVRLETKPEPMEAQEKLLIMHQSDSDQQNQTASKACALNVTSTSDETATATNDDDDVIILEDCKHVESTTSAPLPKTDVSLSIDSGPIQKVRASDCSNQQLHVGQSDKHPRRIMLTTITNQ